MQMDDRRENTTLICRKTQPNTRKRRKLRCRTEKQPDHRHKEEDHSTPNSCDQSERRRKMTIIIIIILLSEQLGQNKPQRRAPNQTPSHCASDGLTGRGGAYRLQTRPLLNSCFCNYCHIQSY